eukprot:1137210-Pelagomonas_calceolata.AAC.2
MESRSAHQVLLRYNGGRNGRHELETNKCVCQHIYKPPPEFPLASPCSGILHLVAVKKLIVALKVG